MSYSKLPFTSGTTMFFYNFTNNQISFELNQVDYECTKGRIVKCVYHGGVRHTVELTAQETSAVLFELLKIMRKQNATIEQNLIRGC